MLKLLMVEDNPATVKLTDAYFKAGGYEPDWATSAEDAKRMLAEKHYDCVVSDVSMPGESGSELSKFIKETYPDTIVFLCSAVPELRTMSDVYGEFYCDGFIDKPVFPAKVEEALGIKEKAVL